MPSERRFSEAKTNVGCITADFLSLQVDHPYKVYSDEGKNRASHECRL